MLNDFIEGFKRAALAAGRKGTVQPYEAGRESAMRKFAAYAPHEMADLAGLGMLAAPVVHDLASDPTKPDSPRLHKLKSVSEIAGLATLAASTLLKPH